MHHRSKCSLHDVKLLLKKYWKQVLENSGWEVIQPSAGISMVAKPKAYLNKTVKLKAGDRKEVELTDSNMRDVFLSHTGVCLNSGSWTGIPGYCRFAFALEDSEFDKAIESIAQFKNVLGN